MWRYEKIYRVKWYSNKWFYIFDYVDLDWAIGLNRCMLKIVGLWPEESKDQREEFLSKIRLLINITTLMFVLTIPSLVSLITVWGDMILMIDNLQFTLPFLILIMKNFIMWYKRGGISLFNYLLASIFKSLFSIILLNLYVYKLIPYLWNYWF